MLFPTFLENKFCWREISGDWVALYYLFFTFYKMATNGSHFECLKEQSNLGLILTLLKITHAASKKSYLIINDPSSHKNLTKNEIS